MTDKGQNKKVQISSTVPPDGFLPYHWNVITPAMAATAAKNINETEETRTKGLKVMREILRSDPDIEFTDEDDILLVFLRSRKFDGERAAEFFKTGLHYVENYRYLLQRKDPAILRKFLRTNTFGFLPYRDSKGRAIIYARADLWDPDEIAAADCIFGGLISVRSAGDNPVNQVTGFVVLLDLKGLRIQQIIAMSKWMLFGTVALQRACPCFMKAFHVINIPSFYKIGWKIVKPLISEKIRKRFIFHKSQDLNSLYEHLPPDILPPELGGKLGPFTNDHWASDSQIDALEKKYYDQLNTNGIISKRKKAAASR
ncbi:alpha-tocopherol transfer protein-like [Parasteatoda tepidariorum]|nr:alpha-tocopherol transfer protein-like isoform X2 [Parasteatoda tepidariorum]